MGQLVRVLFNAQLRPGNSCAQKASRGWGAVVHVCNPSYTGGRQGSEELWSGTAWAKTGGHIPKMTKAKKG
jgi:hypothetical protein